MWSTWWSWWSWWSYESWSSSSSSWTNAVNTSFHHNTACLPSWHDHDIHDDHNDHDDLDNSDLFCFCFRILPLISAKHSWIATVLVTHVVWNLQLFNKYGLSCAVYPLICCFSCLNRVYPVLFILYMLFIFYIVYPTCCLSFICCFSSRISWLFDKHYLVRILHAVYLLSCSMLSNIATELVKPMSSGICGCLSYMLLATLQICCRHCVIHQHVHTWAHHSG